MAPIFKTLYGRLSFVLLGLVVLMGILYVALTLFTTRHYLQEVNQRLNQTLATNLVSEQVLMESGEVNYMALREVFHMLMVVNPAIEIYLLDPRGEILAFTAPPGKVKRQRISLSPIKEYLHGNPAFPILGEDPRDLRRKKIFSAAPIPATGPLQGYLYVILGGEEYDSVVSMFVGSYIFRLSSLAAAGGLAVVLMTGLIFFYILTRRLRRLTAGVEQFSRIDFSEPIPIDSSNDSKPCDEIDQLETTFRQMADRILEQMKTLRQNDALRRELVANVSHDLRTPLASLQGYIETLILKEGKLTPEEQRVYLETAARHGERLGRLVSELLELAKLDAQEIQPRLESFSMGELIQDVTQKFRLAAEKKQVQMKNHFGSDIPLALADIGLMERVLDNLLDNALRYTAAGGSITLSIEQTNGRLITRVSDTGCGIPPDEIPHIFHRFYRVKESVPVESLGTGLGLAIAKRILELHGSDIEVQSTLDVGTTFTFSLPVPPS